jgi:GH15 family glucan-1,4-alpha-glucosidase
MYLYYVYYQYERNIPKKYWDFLKYLVKQIEKNWREKDAGIWEFRGKKKKFTYSKLMCYVGISRAIKIAQHFEKNKYAERLVKLKDQIKDDILKNAWNDEERSFTISYGKKELDAATLMMSYHDFLEDDDPRMVSTVKKIKEKLCKDYLVKRYEIEDDFGKSNTAFTICTFWLIDALYNIGEKKEARKMYKKICERANKFGLFSEGIDIHSKQHRGNFPQAYTHIAMINTSILLSEWSSKRKKLDLQKYPHYVKGLR